MKQFIHLFNTAIENGTFINAVFSNPRKKDGAEKITAKPLLIGTDEVIQFESFKENKAFHENVAPGDTSYFIEKECLGFKQIQCYTTEADYHVLVNKKGDATIKRKAPTKQRPTSLSHNRQKQYILDTPSSHEFLKALGLMDESGHIKPSKYDKYKQINRYLENITDVLPELPEGPLRIVDFGCGKSYLTFALYHYLTVLLNREVAVIGLDLKADVIAFCNKLSAKLGYEGLVFQVGDIGKYTTDQTIDMVVSLHACNTATDAALSKAINWGAKVIFAVPCCHHEAYTQIENDILQPLFKHGILKERLAALITDGMRAQLLESVGYKVSVVEFIDMAHTPKNILIRATLKGTRQKDENAYKKYEALAQMLHLDLSLQRFLQ